MKRHCLREKPSVLLDMSSAGIPRELSPKLSHLSPLFSTSPLLHSQKIQGTQYCGLILFCLTTFTFRRIDLSQRVMYFMSFQFHLRSKGGRGRLNRKTQEWPKDSAPKGGQRSNGVPLSKYSIFPFVLDSVNFDFGC